jgi:hypothetical protein
MAKLKNDPITAEELAEFVNHESDFAFEMQVLAQLKFPRLRMLTLGDISGSGHRKESAVRYPGGQG